ncbi:hypothetical protein TNCV_2073631 [Trichonephila clavipes]|nr:hypothetical protein TNCV_2073631 [Trichonephila clavipes]
MVDSWKVEHSNLPALGISRFLEMLCPLCGNSSQRSEQWSPESVKVAKVQECQAQDCYLGILAKTDRSQTVTQPSLNQYNATTTSVSRITV